MSLPVTSLRNNSIFKAGNSQPYRVVSYQHRTQGRVAAHVTLRTINLITGAARTFTFDASDRVEEADTERKKAQYLYADDSSVYFMDQASFEQFSVSLATVGESKAYLKDAMVVGVLYFEGRPVGIELSNSEVYVVTATEPGIKGDRVSAATKPATIESGAVVKVPLFVRVGDNIRVDTRTGEYLGRG